jgi:hypothetical protein
MMINNLLPNDNGVMIIGIHSGKDPGEDPSSEES